MPHFQLIASGEDGENGEHVLRNVVMALSCGFVALHRSTFMVGVDALGIHLNRDNAIHITVLLMVNMF